MSALQSEVYEAFRDLGADEDKALRAASAIGNALEKVADQHVGDVAAIHSDVTGLRGDVAAIRVELAATKGKVGLLQYMVALCITLLVTILFKLFMR